MCRRFDAHFTNGSSLRGQFQSLAPQSTPPDSCLSYSYPSVPTPEDIRLNLFSASELIQLADVIIIIPAFHAISRLSCYSVRKVLSAVTLSIYSFSTITGIAC